MPLLYITLAGAAAIILFFVLRRRELDKLPEQHHLASLMIAALTDGSGVAPADVSSWLDAQRWSRSRRSVRVSHALTLAHRSVASGYHPTLLALAQRLIDPALP